MRNLILIVSSVISLFLVLGSIPWLRIYFRTGMKSALLRGVGAIVTVIGFFGTVYCFIRYKFLLWDNLFSLLFFLLMIAGALIGIVGDSIFHTKESGLWKEIYEKTPFWKKVIGEVPILKYEKVPPPFFRKRTILIIGISMMTAGILTIITVILFKISFFKGLLIASSITAFITGLLFTIFSITYLNKGQR